MVPHLTTLHLALLSAVVLGFKHGFDYDHIAAISDITSVEPSRAKGMRMGLVYVDRARVDGSRAGRRP